MTEPADQAAAKTGVAAPVLTLSDGDAGSTHNIKVGDTIVFNLPESASDGYSWGLSWSSGGFEEVQRLRMKGPPAAAPAVRLGAWEPRPSI